MGLLGEKRVANLLKKGLKGEEYRLYRNLILPIETEHQNTPSLTEVDLVLLTHFGIFVIEVKNYSGWIFGAEKQAFWTQQIFAKRTDRKSVV